MKALMLASACLVVWVQALSQEQPITLWVPGAYVSSPGNYLQSVPFITAGPTASERYQQVFAASEFGAIPQGGYVTAMTFRRRGIGFFRGYSSTFQVNLSTTSVQPDSLSPVFALNVGPNDQTVFGPGLLFFGGPNDPDDTRTISFATPFLYQPSNGNLLLDMRNLSGNDRLHDNFARDAGDSVYSIGDSISCVFGFGNATSGLVESTGYIVGFQIQPVPEPRTIFFLAAGFSFWALLRGRLTMGSLELTQRKDARSA